MPDLDCEKNSPYQILNRLATGTLKQILRDNFESEGSSTPENDEFITCVMEVVAQREADDPKFQKFDVDAGWRDFQQNYQPREEAAAPVCGETALDGLIEKNERERQIKLKVPQPKRTAHRILRIAVVAAIVACLCAAAASAFQVNIFKMVAHWTQDIFQFRSEETISHNAEYESGTSLKDDQTLKGLLTEESIIPRVYPKWIPDGYTFLESSACTDAEEPIFVSLYENEAVENPITVLVVVHNEPRGMWTEKDAGDVTVYEKNNVKHYIMSNNGALGSMWFVDNFECSITGNVSELEMKMMIDSIYEE